MLVINFRHKIVMSRVLTKCLTVSNKSLLLMRDGFFPKLEIVQDSVTTKEKASTFFHFSTVL